MSINAHKAGSSSINGWAIYLLMYLPLCLLPAVKYSVPYAIAGVFSMLPLLFVSLKNIQYRTILVFLVVFGMIQAVVVVLLGNAPVSEIVNEPIRSVRYFVPCVLLDRVFEFSKKGQKMIWFFTTALIVFVIFQTISALQNDPMVARILAQGSIEDEELMNYRYQNVGGFGNCYAICLTFAMWGYLMLHSSKTMKIISCASMIFILYFSIQVQYMTMFLLCIVAFLIVILFSPSNLYAKMFGFVLVLFIVFSLSSILRWIASLDVDRTIYIKLTEFANTLDGVNTLNDTTSRANLYKDAFLAFLSNPIYGVNNSVNSHSTILGIAASSGMVGLLAYLYGVKQMYTVTKTNFKKQNIDMRIFNIIFALFISLAVVNPIHYVYEISVVLLFYIPLTLNIFAEKVITNKNNDGDFEVDNIFNKSFERKYIQ